MSIIVGQFKVDIKIKSYETIYAKKNINILKESVISNNSITLFHERVWTSLSIFECITVDKNPDWNLGHALSDSYDAKNIHYN